MAGFFARACNRCPRGGLNPAACGKYANSSRSRINSSLKRNLHVKQRSLASSSGLALRSQTLTARFTNPTTSILLSNLQAASIRLMSASAADSSAPSGDSGSSGSESGVAGSAESSDPLKEHVIDTGPTPPDIGSAVANASQPLSADPSSLPVDAIQDIFSPEVIASASGELPLTALGLGGYTPVGLIQNCLDFAHLSLGMPWWGAIVCGTIVFRALVFPLMVKGQINSARLNAVKPELERLQAKMKEAANFQNPMYRAQAAMELQALFQKHDCHPVKALISPLVQMPLFISFFLALRGMANLPVETLRTGGTLWFTDLIAPDPYIALPILASATMLLAIETGAEAGVPNSPQMKTFKNVFRVMTIAIVPLTYKFPAAVFTYWVTSNFISLIQTGVMKHPAVKRFFKIPEPLPQASSVKTSGGFIENFKAGYRSSSELATLKHQEKMKQRAYEKQLKNPHQETFATNPRLEENEKLFNAAKSTLKR